MLRYLKQFKFFFLTLAVLSIIIISVMYSILDVEKPLPIYQPNRIDASLVDSTIQHKKKYHTIADFKLINQNGQTITQDNYKDKIYVADFFFTTCKTICPIMTDQMYRIQQEIINDDEVMLLSHSVTPEIDSVEQLKRYAIEKGVVDNKWNLVTGDRKEIYDLARKSYLVVKRDDAEDYGMVHTENFALIDKDRQIRGLYNGISPTSVDSLLQDIKKLKKEYQ
ncbi:SCO family protein [Psychroserpens sp.]|uniref:SCO family protein n=1 Tax=Psychroserpens sp. TaxID=2020870 RepID=UPI001AFEB741|nr:SCO family protein [Psychroserpens sp.]MBO6605479.1 SCO family protein [Psychroserpens sp.]MBO6631585.1 SCO family protein [Psychroserpens sp.]MBO6653712.1 SCO family protein [Psychroserpens sp.]MBO6682033.1 SCO family protein [Psychroserpens sp.]MBO6748853.1 SCO family protein [Psychroserpens sp.]